MLSNPTIPKKGCLGEGKIVGKMMSFLLSEAIKGKERRKSCEKESLSKVVMVAYKGSIHPSDLIKTKHPDNPLNYNQRFLTSS